MSAHRRVPRPVRHIVFYGTLRARCAPHVRLKLPSALAYVGKCTLRGTLYDLGRYPGFVPGAGIVEGELYRIRSSSLLRRLDEFEGFDPRDRDRSAFVREIVRVGTPARDSALPRYAWVYVYNHVTAGRPAVRGRAWPRGRRPRERARGTREQ
jgi:gamma-glutamylcyclotransferase (GGCT)/AIG2-like uncharacterized protein YtfP